MLMTPRWQGRAPLALAQPWRPLPASGDLQGRRHGLQRRWGQESISQGAKGAWHPGRSARGGEDGHCIRRVPARPLLPEPPARRTASLLRPAPLLCTEPARAILETHERSEVSAAAARDNRQPPGPGAAVGLAAVCLSGNAAAAGSAEHRPGLPPPLSPPLRPAGTAQPGRRPHCCIDLLGLRLFSKHTHHPPPPPPLACRPPAPIVRPGAAALPRLQTSRGGAAGPRTRSPAAPAAGPRWKGRQGAPASLPPPE